MIVDRIEGRKARIHYVRQGNKRKQYIKVKKLHACESYEYLWTKRRYEKDGIYYE